MNKEYLEALERLAMPDELHIKECKKLGIGLTEDYDLIKQALTTKPKVMIDYYTKVKIDRFFELWYKVDCDGDEILHDMKTPKELEEMEHLRKELEEKGIEVI